MHGANQQTKLIPCTGCGALVPDVDGPTHRYIGASPGCWAIFGEVLAKEYSDYARYTSAHQLTVDAYAAQHPGIPSRQSTQSVAIHLISLHVLLERGLDTAQATNTMRRALKRWEEFVWLEPPESPGWLTILDVIGAQDLAEHQSAVRRWAESVWEAWALHHATVRRWAAFDSQE
jgi:hypothetical protein